MLGLPGDILGRIFVENLLTQHLPGHGKQTARPGDAGQAVVVLPLAVAAVTFLAARTAAAATVTRAHQRQRGEGSDPVGVSSSTKLTAVCAMTMVTGQDLVTAPAAGRAPGRARSP
jgi:hypothetical protein